MKTIGRRVTDLWKIAVFFCNGNQYNAYGLYDAYHDPQPCTRRYCLAKPLPDRPGHNDNAHAIDRLIAKCENMTTEQIDAITQTIA